MTKQFAETKAIMRQIYEIPLSVKNTLRGFVRLH
jgi:hypothetical protein